jgi:hypothetical protein
MSIDLIQLSDEMIVMTETTFDQGRPYEFTKDCKVF